MLSPEDVAWADSCLSKDPDMLDTGWNLNCLKEALLETSTSQNNLHLYEKDDYSRVSADMEILPEEDTVDARKSVKAAINNETETNSYDFWSNPKVEDIFLPTYNENSRDLGVSDQETGFVFQTFQLDQSAGEIFKIWDLDLLPEEDDDLVQQLNKALGENSLDSISSGSDDNEAKAWKNLSVESLDDLISGIADLGLTPNSGLIIFDFYV